MYGKWFVTSILSYQSVCRTNGNDVDCAQYTHRRTTIDRRPQWVMRVGDEDMRRMLNSLLDCHVDRQCSAAWAESREYRRKLTCILGRLLEWFSMAMVGGNVAIDIFSVSPADVDGQLNDSFTSLQTDGNKSKPYIYVYIYLVRIRMPVQNGFIYLWKLWWIVARVSIFS